MVLGVIPSVIVYRAGLDSLGLWQSHPATRFILPVIGIAFIALGLSLMAATIRLFGTVGQGTLAPWNPPQRLVVDGVYRHVRNPMISGVVLVLLGESALTASRPILCWSLFFASMVAVAIPAIEEPGLVRRFGENYLAYKRNVPRWIPRRVPWQGR
jgi:protein-S-isoprenylcysteine O-methyltransferase Ste14